MPLVLRGATAYLDQGHVLENSDITLDNGKILAIRPAKSEPVLPGSNIIGLPRDRIILPGLIDMHIHGAKGKDVMDATHDALSTIANTLLHEGVTGFLATTMTDSMAHIEAALLNIKTFVNTNKSPNCAKILGIHLEGPFLSKDKAGVHTAAHLLTPDIDLFHRWQALSGQLIKVVTVAPELDHAIPFINALCAEGVIAAIGHTNATYEQTQRAIDAGATYATHLFNAMTPIHHRHPGAATALLLNDKVHAELIVDHEHVHPAMVKLAYQQKGADKLLLVTDAMKAKCCTPGKYRMNDQCIDVSATSAKTKDGVLAGSLLTMNRALANMHAITKEPFVTLTHMASTLPATLLGLYPQKGTLRESADADLIIVDPALNVTGHVIAGHYTAIDHTQAPLIAQPSIDNSSLTDSL